MWSTQLCSLISGANKLDVIEEKPPQRRQDNLEMQQLIGVLKNPVNLHNFRLAPMNQNAVAWVKNAKTHKVEIRKDKDPVLVLCEDSEQGFESNVDLVDVWNRIGKLVTFWFSMGLREFSLTFTIQDGNLFVLDAATV